MNIALAVPSIVLSRVDRREATLWGAASVAALILHLAIILIFHAMQPAVADFGSPIALTIDLEAMPSATVTNSEASMSDEVPPNEPEPLENPEAAVESEPVTESVRKPEPLEEVIPDPFEVQTPNVVVRLPQPRPVREKPRLQKMQVKEPLEKAKPEAPATRNQMASAGSSGATLMRWRKKVQAWVERRKIYPPEAERKGQEGTVEVKFTIDANGYVTSSHVTRSSGNPLMDKEALEMLERASPLPPPPRGYNTASLISMPVGFNLRALR